ncbi:LAME_0D09956g1_1 [Lachancea meyersii CBS 8951]|uniref:Autophagy-related protein n=1 Tax=Lachancea meyersii CBS 8951 TaxID=1266667 RepID=A0A1G4JBD3_9SACH|nr:LAME_0D09956g1_1 [Lachancea meyersii CBS 8951]
MDLTGRYGSVEEASRHRQNDDSPANKRTLSQTALVEVISVDDTSVNTESGNPLKEENMNEWNKNQVFLAWLFVCFSTGPTSSMIKVYIPAVIQSLSHALGHQKNSQNKCTPRGDNCYVSFGGTDVQYSSYVLYLKAIYTALEGLIAIFVMAFADYSSCRRTMLAASVIFFGLLACPFAALYKESRASLISVSVLYCLMLIVETVYQIIEGSYVPIFMIAASQKLGQGAPSRESGGVALRRGSKVSALGLIMGNVGGILSLIVGVMITHIGGSSISADYRNYLIAITVAGSMTVLIGLVSVFFIPNIQGRALKIDSSGSKARVFLMLPFIKLKQITEDVWKYKQVMRYVIAWVLWNISFSNFLSVIALMYRSTLGLNSSNAEYTVWQLMGNIVALLGSLLWMLVYNWQCRRFSDAKNVMLIKQSLYILLFFGWFVNFWGALGANPNSVVGFKHRWEFWTGLVLFMSTSSAIRSLNRVVYSSMLPKGKENQFFGLEIMLGLLTGWTEPLIIAAISDRTGNLRLPYVPNTILFTVATVFFYSCDIEAGMRQVAKI